MKTLLLLRHAKSSWKDDTLPDHDRPLNRRGERDAPRMGRLIDAQSIVPDLIVSSTARRARLTAEAVAEACGYADPITYESRLYHADPEEHRSVLRHVDDDHDRVMLVGHNPGKELLVQALTGAWERMPTAALACIELPIESWLDLDDTISGALIALWRPRELDDA